jgi:hypothetical protein
VALAASVAGTDLGLSKVPYLRESRRSIGIHNFRLMWENMTSQYVPPSPPVIFIAIAFVTKIN